jgi:hypothetical protein
MVVVVGAEDGRYSEEGARCSLVYLYSLACVLDQESL